MQLLPSQSEVCKRFGVAPMAPLQYDRLGIALETLHFAPINGLRIPALPGLSGWFIFGGAEPSEEDDFYAPLCVRHLREYCEIAIPYLCLPVGWRFQIDKDGYEDVWYDGLLLEQTD